ncbi:hypothetical protein N2152v2_005458 [Parachlorella kessleri]
MDVEMGRQRRPAKPPQARARLSSRLTPTTALGAIAVLAAVVWAGSLLAGSGGAAATGTGAQHNPATAARGRVAQQQQRSSRSSSSSSGGGPGGGGHAGLAGPELLTYKVVQEFPHDPEAFTQGLQYDRACAADGFSCKDILWESTGLNGRSSVREVELETGRVLRSARLPQRDFGEGITRLGDRLYQVTWLSPRTWSWAVANFSDAQLLQSPLKDGWGITTDGEHLIVGDSTETLHFLDPSTMAPLRTLNVTDGGVAVRWINELEWVDGHILANVWMRDCIARINPDTGTVAAWVHLQGLKQSMLQALSPHERQRTDVLNGIAWDTAGQRLFVTGKLWPRLYQIELVPLQPSNYEATLERLRQESAPPVPAPQRVADWSNTAEHLEELVELKNNTCSWGPDRLYSKNQVESKWTTIYEHYSTSQPPAEGPAQAAPLQQSVPLLRLPAALEMGVLPLALPELLAWPPPHERKASQGQGHGYNVLPPAVPGTALHFIQQATAVPQIWDMLASLHGDNTAMVDPHANPPAEYTFREVDGMIRLFAAGLYALGISKGDKVSLFSENSSRWMIADQGIMLAGAAGAVRGVLSIPTEELKYIMTMSESKAVVVQDPSVLDRLLPVLDSPDGAGIGTVVSLWGQPSQQAKQALRGREVLSFDQVLEIGAAARDEFSPPAMTREDVATLCYTSGTTGHPKAAVLCHGNLLHQLEALDFLGAHAGQKTVSYLPPWHMYGRTLEYYLHSRGVTQVYSNLRRLKDDLAQQRPNMFISVPLMLDNLHRTAMQRISRLPHNERRLAESLFAASKRYIEAARLVRGVDVRHGRKPPSDEELAKARTTATALAPVHMLAHRLVYRKIRRDLGIQDWVISGGGSLAAHLDDWFQIIGLQVMVGYGLTETSPVLTVRHKGLRKNVRGTIGPPVPGIEMRIVDPKTLQDLPDGEQGLMLARGPAVMRGYYKNDKATHAAFPFGDDWFDTGDLGCRVPHSVQGSNMGGNIVITGRAKDTIVLTNGENIEPQPLEDMVQVSPYIKFCVLFGQRALGALIVPDLEALEGSLDKDDEGNVSRDHLRSVVHAEISRALAARPSRERITAFELVEEEFSVENGTLTRTMKPRRQVIQSKYRSEVERLISQLS